jgi:hypothetical protein
MASKRGRPLVDESESSAINQNRKKTRERMQRLRSERKQQNKVAIPPTAGQLRQGEQIINLGSIGEENGSHTPAQVGLRVTLVREHLFPRHVVGVAVYTSILASRCGGNLAAQGLTLYMLSLMSCKR